VFVHGGFDDASVWRPQLEGLSDEFDVVAWDEPGAGRSELPPPGFTLADYADCLAAFIEALGLAPAHVAGLSWGGTVVLELYNRHPEVVRTLILADTYVGWKGSLPAAEVAARLHENRTAPNAVLMAEADLTDVLPQIAAPTLLVWGEDDERSPLNVARQFSEAIAGSRLVTIPRAGHMSNVDQPEAFNEAIRAFVRGLPEQR
jgi:pimeloyl-ACP methyl ester carboxylesterase